MCCNDVMALRTKTPKVSLHYSPLTPVKSPYLPTGTRLSSPPWIGPRACALVVDRTRPCYQIGPSRARSRRKRAVESGHRRCPCPVKAHMGGGGEESGAMHWVCVLYSSTVISAAGREQEPLSRAPHRRARASRGDKEGDDGKSNEGGRLAPWRTTRCDMNARRGSHWTRMRASINLNCAGWPAPVNSPCIALATPKAKADMDHVAAGLWTKKKRPREPKEKDE